MHSQVSNVQPQHVQNVRHVKQVKARQRTMTYAKSQATQVEHLFAVLLLDLGALQ